jgi:hypothetical protein
MILHPFFCPNRRTLRPGLSQKSASRKKPDHRPAKAGPASQRPPPLPRFNCRHAASHNSALRSFRLARHRSSPGPAPPTAVHAPPTLRPCSTLAPRARPPLLAHQPRQPTSARTRALPGRLAAARPRTLPRDTDRPSSPARRPAPAQACPATPLSAWPCMPSQLQVHCSTDRK